jgi:hypothetical protein
VHFGRPAFGDRPGASHRWRAASDVSGGATAAVTTPASACQLASRRSVWRPARHCHLAETPLVTGPVLDLLQG